MSLGGVVVLDIGFHGFPARVKRVEDGVLQSLVGQFRDEVFW